MRQGIGLKTGIPCGQSIDTMNAIRPIIQAEAEKITKIMTEKLGVEDEYAKKALEYVVGVIAADQIEPTNTKLQAAKIILDFTKSKPASNANVTISKAEDFLKALVAEEANGPSTDEDEEASA